MMPIETIYKGYRFRSRLEARWAVFFDAMGIKWDYELEGFVLSDGTWYLPDFKIEDGPYIEVKPRQLSAQEMHKVKLFSEHHPILLAIGVPEPIGYEVLEPGMEYYGCIVLCYHKGEPGNWEIYGVGEKYGDDKLEKACNAAKQARFEHGEKIP